MWTYLDGIPSNVADHLLFLLLMCQIEQDQHDLQAVTYLGEPLGPERTSSAQLTLPGPLALGNFHLLGLAILLRPLERSPGHEVRKRQLTRLVFVSCRLTSHHDGLLSALNAQPDGTDAK